MALDLQLTKSGVTSDYTKIKITDNTGTYNVDSNPGGYGTPNLSRSDVTLWLESAVNKRNSEDVDVDVDAYTPTSVTDWFVQLNLDGWYQMIGYTIQNFDNSTNSYPTDDKFSVNELVYDPSNNSFYEITEVTGSGPYSYISTLLTSNNVSDALIEGTDDIFPFQSETLNTYDLSNLNILNAKALKKYYATKSDDDWETYQTMTALLSLIMYEFENGNYTTAQDLVEKLEQYEDCLSSITCTIAGS